jgi:hypothetical protein
MPRYVLITVKDFSDKSIISRDYIDGVSES